MRRILVRTAEEFKAAMNSAADGIEIVWPGLYLFA